MYLATMTGPTGGENAMSSDVPVGRVEVVVQFTARCNEDAHRLLAKHYFALKLHACVQVCGDLFIVVMEGGMGGGESLRTPSFLHLPRRPGCCCARCCTRRASSLAISGHPTSWLSRVDPAPGSTVLDIYLLTLIVLKGTILTDIQLCL